MKLYRLFIITIFLCLFIETVNAGTVYNLDFSTNLVQQITLQNRDAVEFELEGKTHRIMIKEIKYPAVEIASFIEGAKTPYYAEIDYNNYLRLDFDRDGETDMFVGLREAKANEATLVLKREIKQEGLSFNNFLTGYSVAVGSLEFNLMGLLITIIIIIVGLGIYFILIKNKKIYKQ